MTRYTTQPAGLLFWCASIEPSPLSHHFIQLLFNTLYCSFLEFLIGSECTYRLSVPLNICSTSVQYSVDIIILLLSSDFTIHMLNLYFRNLWICQIPLPKLYLSVKFPFCASFIAYFTCKTIEEDTMYYRDDDGSLNILTYLLNLPNLLEILTVNVSTKTINIHTIFLTGCRLFHKLSNFRRVITKVRNSLHNIYK